MSKPRGDISHTTESLLFFDDAVKTIYWTCPFLFSFKSLRECFGYFQNSETSFLLRDISWYMFPCHKGIAIKDSLYSYRI